MVSLESDLHKPTQISLMETLQSYEEKDGEEEEGEEEDEEEEEEEEE